MQIRVSTVIFIAFILLWTDIARAHATFYPSNKSVLNTKSASLPISVTQVANQTYAQGATTNLIAFSGYFSTVSWTNDNTAIGLPASGYGNITSFTAVNTGSVVLVANITVTPHDGRGTNGTPISFTITVEPDGATTAAVLMSEVTGTSIACGGDPSASPYVQHFTVEGYNLSDNLVLSPSPNIEISTNAINGYQSKLNLTATAGVLAKTDIYVRSAAATPIGIWSGYITATTGAVNKKIAVNGKVYSYGHIDQLDNKIWSAGSTNAIQFTGTTTDFTWTNDNTAIGLPASGTGNIAAFKAINNTKTVITANITVTPVNPSACSAGPMTFAITVKPHESMALSGSLSQLNTVYGTPSSTDSLTVLDDNMQAGITVTPPTGFEVSKDGKSFSATVTVNNAADLVSGKVYLRLAAKTPVGVYGGSVNITSDGMTDSTMLTATKNKVSPATLTIIADNKSKITNAPNPALSLTYKGFVNNETAAVLTTQPSVSTTAILSSPVGNYPIVAAGAVSPNYTINYTDGVLQVTSAPLSIVVNNAFTPNGDGINDTWTIKNIEAFPKSVVQVYNRYGSVIFHSVGYSVPWSGKFNGADLSTGTYYYIIDLKDGSRPTTGSLTIIR